MASIRLVEPDEVPETPAAEPILSLEAAVETGDYRTILLAQRRDIVTKLREATGPAAAALHRQLSLTSRELQQLDAAQADEGVGSAADIPPAEFDPAQVWGAASG